MMDALKGVATTGPGWEWTDEGRKKWGFVSTTPGSVLNITVSSKLTSVKTALEMVRLGVVGVACLAGLMLRCG